MSKIQRLATDHIAFHAWMEDHDWWDGNALYVDLDLAKAHAAHDYEADEYPEPDDDESADRPAFAWNFEHGRWFLNDHGKDTLVRVTPTSIFRNATPDEVAQQDAERAARAAKYTGMPMDQALVAAARDHQGAVTA